jgi:hypothetical protein
MPGDQAIEFEVRAEEDRADARLVSSGTGNFSSR